MAFAPLPWATTCPGPHGLAWVFCPFEPTHSVTLLSSVNSYPNYWKNEVAFKTYETLAWDLALQWWKMAKKKLDHFEGLPIFLLFYPIFAFFPTMQSQVLG